MASPEYHRYLASREWALKKKAVKKRAAGMCERCHLKPMDSVHHLTYERIYHEDMKDLLAVCFHCHQYLSAEISEDPIYDMQVEPSWPCCGCGGKTESKAGDWCQSCQEKANLEREALIKELSAERDRCFLCGDFSCLVGRTGNMWFCESCSDELQQRGKISALPNKERREAV